MRENIRKIKFLVKEYEEAYQNLSEMISRWEDYDDPGSDPGLQFEQEMVCESIYNQIKELAKQL